MSNNREDDNGLALAADASVRYIARTRAWYSALGYEMPYRWARNEEVPFTRLAKPLSRCRVALVTTAAPFQADKGDQGPGAPYNGAAKFFSVYSFDSRADADLRISHIAIDRKHTTAADIGTYLPGRVLRAALAAGRVGELSPRFHGLPTNRSHRVTLDVDGPELVARCVADRVDAAILVPNCPVCHQSTALAARALEVSGVATVVMGCAKDIVDAAGVPRFVFSDFPLGNSAGRPHDPASQALTLELALSLLESATAPRTTVKSPLRWNDDPSEAWKLDYCNAGQLSAGELHHRRAEFDAAKVDAQTTKSLPRVTGELASEVR